MASAFLPQMPTTPSRCPSLHAVKASSSPLDDLAADAGVTWMAQYGEQYKEIKMTKVRPVETTVSLFVAEYKKPIIPFYRTITNEILQINHLALFDAKFKYTPIYALGYITAFDSYFKGYPVPGEAQRLRDSAAKALGLDISKLEADANTVLEWAKGKTAQDYLAAIESPAAGDAIGQMLSEIKKTEGFLADRFFTFGMFRLMEVIGAEVNADSISVWFKALGLSEFKPQLDFDLYSLSLKKLQDVELMMKAVEIREKKRLAERLEAKAKKAAEAAAESLAQGSEVKSSTPAPAQPAAIARS